jgi:hypothetical protein
MTKQELLDKLDEIKDKLTDVDSMKNFGTDGVCDDVDDLMFEINVNTEDF